AGTVPTRLARVLRGAARVGGASVDAHGLPLDGDHGLRAHARHRAVPHGAARHGAGSLALLETVGVGTGLLIYAAAVGALGSQSIALPLVALACRGAAASVYLVPETARRELEEVS